MEPLKPVRRTLSLPRFLLLIAGVCCLLVALPLQGGADALKTEIEGWKPPPVRIPEKPEPTLVLASPAGIPGVASEILAAGKRAGIKEIMMRTGKVKRASKETGLSSSYGTLHIELDVEGKYAHIYGLATAIEARKDSVLLGAELIRHVPEVKARLTMEVMVRLPPAAEAGTETAGEEEM